VWKRRSFDSSESRVEEDGSVASSITTRIGWMEWGMGVEACGPADKVLCCEPASGRPESFLKGVDSPKQANMIKGSLEGAGR
jgi:hypothetical protein